MILLTIGDQTGVIKVMMIKKYGEEKPNVIKNLNLKKGIIVDCVFNAMVIEY